MSKSEEKSAIVASNSILDLATEFEVDEDLMSPEYNEVRTRRYPYAIVVNEQKSGIFFPESSLLKAGWSGDMAFEDFTYPSGEADKGKFFDRLRMSVLGSTPAHIVYKNMPELGDLAGQYVGLFEEKKHLLDKKTMSVQSEVLVVLLDSENNPLHNTPISVRFKNVSYYSLRSALDEFYTRCESNFSQLTRRKNSGKNDIWRSLCVVTLRFQGEKVGEGSNKSWCCKVAEIVKPTPKTFPQFFLGKGEKKSNILNIRGGFCIDDFVQQKRDVIEASYEPVNQPLLAASVELEDTQTPF